MKRWEVVFFPPAEHRHSPINYFKSLPNHGEKALIRRRLDLLSDLEMSDWPHWVKKVGEHYQITASAHRIYFGLDGRVLVVCHICRKVSQKALISDLERANINFELYKKSV